MFGEASRSLPPLAVPPLSWTWNVNEVYDVPLPLAAGWKTSRPDAMSPAETYCPAVTLVPLSFTVPAAGSVVIFTASSAWGSSSAASAYPKSAVVRVRGVSSVAVSVADVPVGAMFGRATTSRSS